MAGLPVGLTAGAGSRALLVAALSAPAIATGQTPPGGPASELAPVEVVGRTESGAYHAEEAEGAKTDLPLRELPQSVRTITRQAIDDLGAIRLDDVLDYVGGVSRQNNFGGLWDNIAIRGLPGNENTGMATLLNGFPSNRGFNAPRDLAPVERIEFLKGPASALYGSSEPGGTLNMVSKRPQWRAAHSVEAYLGSFGFWRGALDTTGPIGDSVAYRLNAAIEQRDGFRDFVGTDRWVFAPALSARLGPRTSLEYVGEFLHQATPLDRGVVAVGGRLGTIPRSRFLGEPGDGALEVDNRTHQIVLGHAWSEQWRGRLGLQYRETTLQGFSTEATALLADDRTLRRQRRYRDYRSDDVTVQAEVIGNVRAMGLEHELLIGLETSNFDQDTLMLRVNPTAAAPYAIDILAPVYGQTRPAPLPNTDTRDRLKTHALYVQDSIRVAQDWRLVAGLRIDDVEQSLLNRRNGTTTVTDLTATSPRLGVTWLASRNLSLYANSGRSFRPNVGADAAGAAFDPESARSAELGAKWESDDRRLGATAALFDIRKRNVLTADPANTGFSVAAGEIGSRGLELDVAGQLTRNWRLNASFVYSDVRVLRDNTLEVDGRLLNSPRVNGSVLAVYEDALPNGQRFGVGGGVTHVGTRLGQARTQAEAAAGTPAFELPSYTTARLVAWWRLTPSLRLTLDVDNVFDTAFYTSSFSRVWITPGTPRMVTAGIQGRF
ncbi:MAG: TonB-dependent siderophore receptor [Burkholderiales bacterium]|nr:MAG: TonB-dependent siderophore receptor [Burkholderiales bacterium]